MPEDREIQPSAQADPELRGVNEPSPDLDKVRDILFGAQIRDQDKRMGRMQANLLKEIAKAKEDADQRFAALERTLQDEFRNLTQRLEREEDERAAARAELGSELRDLSTRLSAELGQLAADSQRTTRDLENRLTNEASEIRSELHKKSEDILSRTKQDVDRLNDGKADRNVLSTLLTDLASRLTGEEESKSDDGESAD